MRTIRIKKILALMPIIFIILLSACTSWLPEAHHIEIQQGNFITQTERDQLELGMSKEEVKDG